MCNGSSRRRRPHWSGAPQHRRTRHAPGTPPTSRHPSGPSVLSAERHHPDAVGDGEPPRAAPSQRRGGGRRSLQISAMSPGGLVGYRARHRAHEADRKVDREVPRAVRADDRRPDRRARRRAAAAIRGGEDVAAHIGRAAHAVAAFHDVVVGDRPFCDLETVQSVRAPCAPCDAGSRTEPRRRATGEVVPPLELVRAEEPSVFPRRNDRRSWK